MLTDWSVRSVPALLALLTLAIPVLIHLFNKSRGRLVRIGHIELVRQARRLRVTEVQLAQYLLLFLRLCIFTLAALILAQLLKPGLDSTGRDQAYLSPAWLRAADEAQWQALERAPGGTELRLLAPGYELLDATRAGALQALPADPAPESIWPLLAQRLSDIGHRGNVSVYVTDRASQFGERLPNLPRAVDWHVLPAPPADRLPPGPFHVVLAYDTAREQDAAALRAALAALQRHRLPGLTLEVISPVPVLADLPAADFHILLGTRAPEGQAPDAQGRVTRLLQDAGSLPGQRVAEQVVLPSWPFTRFEVERLAPLRSEASVRWHSASGYAVLLEQQQAGVTLLQLTSRFSAQWNNLAQQPDFPYVLLQLMLPDALQARRYDSARIDQRQLLQSGPEQHVAARLPHTPLHPWLAALLVLAFIAERLLAERRGRPDG